MLSVLLPKFSIRENGKTIQTHHPILGNLAEHLDEKGFEVCFALKTEELISKGLEEASCQPHDIDYQGTWEDAFLYKGYENGKYRFLTGFFLQNIQELGFLFSSSYHNPTFRNDKIGKNWIVCQLTYRGENCIPEKDRAGNKVVLGVTEPRLYLPAIVQKLLDIEFGYDMERTRYR